MNDIKFLSNISTNFPIRKYQELIDRVYCKKKDFFFYFFYTFLFFKIRMRI